MGQIKKRSLYTDPELREILRKSYEYILTRLDSQERLIMLYPEYHKRVKKQREERLKRDPLADAW